MDSREPAPKRELRPKTPKWSSPLWYLPIMLLLLWFWQSTVSQFAYRTIPYSEFKEHLNQHEVIRCVVKEDEIQGEIHPKTRPATRPEADSETNASSAAKTAAAAKSFLFRTVRVENPKLVDELEAAGVRFRGE